jgi:FlaA1/EpsC-like NDP-sugar epimerase
MIGTPATIRTLFAQLSLLENAPQIRGCIVTSRDDVAAWKKDDSQDTRNLLNSAGAPSGTTRPPLLGTIDELARLHDLVGITDAIVSLPRSAGAISQRVSTALRALGIAERVVAPLSEQLSRSPAASAMAPPIDLIDLIGRTPFGIDRRMVSKILTGKRVLITGAGGSIGSELARIAATFHPEELVLFERAENSLFEIDRQLARRFPDVKRRAVLHDVADEELTRRRLDEIRPHVVFHAAAHKHVPLMEDHPADAVVNNFFGTRSIADASAWCGAERFVLISSDKAVNPSSVMGATKRLAEMYVQGLHRSLHTTEATCRGGGTCASRRCRSGRLDAADSAPPTRFSMVRFGNVLGSACSVLPIWASQIADGGPVTVTDPRMTRYFMTIPEAAALVIQSAAIETDAAKGAAVYVLDMGEPVRILDLAERFVRSHNFRPRLVDARPGNDNPPVEMPDVVEREDAPAMEIVLSGTRPGEKLHEELAYAAEQLRPTPCAGINSWAGPLNSAFDLETLVADLARVRRSWDRAGVLATIRRHVPEMKSPQKDSDATVSASSPVVAAALGISTPHTIVTAAGASPSIVTVAPVPAAAETAAAGQGTDSASPTSDSPGIQRLAA